MQPYEKKRVWPLPPVYQEGEVVLTLTEAEKHGSILIKSALPSKTNL